MLKSSKAQSNLLQLVSELGESEKEEDPRRSEIGKVKGNVIDISEIKIETSLDRESQDRLR